MEGKNQNINTKAKPVQVKRRNKKVLIALIFAAILVLGATGTVIALSVANSQSSSQPAEEKKNDSKTETDDSKQVNSDISSSSNNPENKTPAKYEGEDPNNYDNLTGIITFAGVAEGKFMISVAIDQYITGSCKIVASGPTGSEISADVDIMAGPSSSFCSYSGPTPTDHGKYNITVTLTGANKTGTITGEVEI